MSEVQRPRGLGRKAWALAVLGLVLSVLYIEPGRADDPSGCDFYTITKQQGNTVTTNECVGPLTGSTFEGGDGNLVVNTSGSTDWSNAPDRAVGTDLPSGSGDNSLGQGTKEDDPNVSVVSGSIPPNKSDLSRFYVGSEFRSNANYLYLAWERTNVLGSANMDFEINHATTAGFTSTTTGAVTLNRTAGDVLVTFDFNNGGGKPALALLRWVTTGAASQCFSANAVPCWGNRVALNSSNSQGAVNNPGSVNDPVSGGTLPALTFGEAAINLTAAGVFPTGTCEAFGSAFLKSRASASFPAEVKDFVAPVPINISNCGTVKIIKRTNPRGLNQSFSYTSTLPNPASGSTTPTCSLDATPSSFSLNDSGNSTSDSTANTEVCTNVPAGSYTVTEGALPANFTLESLSCSATGTGSSGAQDANNPAQANITVAPNGVVECVYTNRGSGAIEVTKTAKNVAQGPGDHPLAGATFSVNGVSKVTDANGKACFDGLTVGGTYTVTETSPPSGYGIDTASKDVTVSAVGSCPNTGTLTPVSFTNSPLTDISVNATSQVAGATNSKITCVDAANAAVGNSPQGFADPVTVTATGLRPGTYTCTIEIDP